MKKAIGIFIVIFILILSFGLLAFSYYTYQLSPVSSDNKLIEVDIPKGTSSTRIATILKEKKLIRDANVFRIYLKLNNITNMSFGTYKLNEAMSVKQIVEVISKGETVNKDIKITFKEGLNMRGIAKVIATNTNNTEEDVFNLLKDKTYIDSLIDEYWFLTDDIKDPKIYYSLEGYLAPNTYNFVNKDVSVKDIFKRMLNQTEIVLNNYKKDIEKSNLSIHELITLASIVESEGVNDDDRPDIASVFYNRLAIDMAFQSCSTACYARKFDGPCSPSNVDTAYVSPYNTYQANMIGLPVGPISNPSIESIEAAINPTTTKYLYFLADEYKKTYFFDTYVKHQAKKQELKANGDKLYN